MPYYRRRPRYYRRRRPNLLRWPVGGSGFPSQKIVRFRFHDTYALSSTAALTVQAVGANDPFAPSPASPSHQPMGWDFWAQLYGSYVCISSKCTCRFTWAGPIAGAWPGNVLVGLGLQDNLAVGPGAWTINNIAETGRYRWNTIPCNSAAGGDNQKLLSETWSAKRWFGISNISDNVDRIGNVVTASPPELAYYSIIVGNPIAGAAFGSNVNMQIETTVEYLVMFSEPQDLVQS